MFKEVAKCERRDYVTAIVVAIDTVAFLQVGRVFSGFLSCLA